MNLLQCAPLCDSHGRVKYFIGAQIDVSGLAMEGASMESLMELQTKYHDPEDGSIMEPPPAEEKDEFQELNELFSPRELSSVQQHGGHLFQPVKSMASPQDPRSWLKRGTSLESETEAIRLRDMKSPFFRMSLAGVYENVRNFLAFWFNCRANLCSTYLFDLILLYEFCSLLRHSRFRGCCNHHSYRESAVPRQ